jgi:hypothetical protein
VSRLLPVGAYVLVRDPGCRDGDRQIIEPRTYAGRITGYSSFHDKYALDVHYGHGLWSTGYPHYTFVAWCEQVTERQAAAIEPEAGPR